MGRSAETVVTSQLGHGLDRRALPTSNLLWTRSKMFYIVTNVAGRMSSQLRLKLIVIITAVAAEEDDDAAGDTAGAALRFDDDHM